MSDRSVFCMSDEHCPRDSHPAARGPSAAETGPGVQRRGPGTDRDLSIIAGRDWGQEKGTTEDEMAGWHHRLDGYEFELSKLRELMMDREARHAAVHGVAKSRTRLSD